MLRKLAIVLTTGVTLSVMLNHVAPAEPRQSQTPTDSKIDRRTVWSGVYTAAQAIRGKTHYDASCSGCHGMDLSSGSARALRGDTFMESWGEDTLNTLHNVIKASMPRGTPGSLSDDAYVAIIAYILEVNSFPAGTDELKTELMESVRIEGKNGPEPVPNFALVQLAGCLVQGPGNEWTLTDATDPRRTRNPAVSKDGELKNVEQRPLGTQKFQLMNAYPRPDAHKGNKVEVKGLLIRDPSNNRINVTSVQTIKPGCTP